jgi:hypothetical protein
MFAERSFGPYSESFRSIRDLLLAKCKVAVHFFALSYEDLPMRVQALNESFCSQREETPLLSWYTNRKLNVQKGQQLPEEARPQYTIPARLQFDSDDDPQLGSGTAVRATVGAVQCCSPHFGSRKSSRSRSVIGSAHAMLVSIR